MTIGPSKPKKGPGPKELRQLPIAHIPPAVAGPSTSNVAVCPDKERTRARKIKKEPPVHGTPPQKKSQLRSRSPSPCLNSDDEHTSGFRNEEMEAEFAARLATRGLQIKIMKGDGACMFRAVADQVYGDEEMHDEVRRLCMDYMNGNRDHFSPFITEDFDQYIARKRLSTTHGNHAELQAISEIYARPVEIYEYNDRPINVFNPLAGPGTNAPLRLSYHGSVHYNAVIDPNRATIGVGLGLPGHVPGAADAQLLAEASRQDDALQIENAMLQDKLHMTDWQRTDEEIKEQVAMESYKDYVRSLESVDQKLSVPDRDQDQPCGSKSSCPPRSPQPCSSKQTETTDQNLYEELLALGAVDDDDEETIMARAMLMSQQQFMEDLQKKNDKDTGSA